MTREQRIVHTFVEFASTLAEGVDVDEFLHSLVRRSEELLECSEAGLLLADPAGFLRVMASSSERSEALDVLQLQNEEGPCFECFRRGEAVASADLEADAARWPAFAPVAVQMGYHSVQAVPMRVGGKTIGAVNLFRSQTGSLPPEDMDLAQGMADLAAVGLLHERSLRESRLLVEQLQTALTSRVVIEQAKGVLAARAGVGVDEAFARMRAHARSHNLRLSDVAREVIDARLAP